MGEFSSSVTKVYITVKYVTQLSWIANLLKTARMNKEMDGWTAKKKHNKGEEGRRKERYTLWLCNVNWTANRGCVILCACLQTKTKHKTYVQINKYILIYMINDKKQSYNRGLNTNRDVDFYFLRMQKAKLYHVYIEVKNTLSAFTDQSPLNLIYKNKLISISNLHIK